MNQLDIDVSPSANIIAFRLGLQMCPLALTHMTLDRQLKTIRLLKAI